MSAAAGGRAAALQKLVHFLTAFTGFLKAFTKLEHPQGYWPLIVFLFASSLYITAITLLHDRLHRHERLLTSSVYAIESILTGAMAWIAFSEGKKGLPWVFAIAAVLFLVSAMVRLSRK